MDAEKVIQDLNMRFALPLKEFYKRRIIFWYDEEQEFIDKIADVQLDNAKVIALTGNNSFAVKKLLGVDDVESNYLVYCPISFEHESERWLMDVEQYSEEFRADLISIWLNELGIPSNLEMRRVVKGYRKFFNAKERRAKLAGLKDVPLTPKDLHLSVMATLCNQKIAQPNYIILSVLQAGLDYESNAIYQNLVKYEVDKIFWQLIAQATGYMADEPQLDELATHILLTALSRTVPKERFGGLDNYISESCQAYCYDLVNEWKQSQEADNLFAVTVMIEEKLQLTGRFMNLPINELVSSDIFPCINEVILAKTIKDIANHNVNADFLISLVENRRTSAWYEKFENYFEGLMLVAKMYNFYKQNAQGFHTVNPRELWNSYVSEYYEVDTYYREFCKYFVATSKDGNGDLRDLYHNVMDYVEDLYNNWFLGQLSESWTRACEDELGKHGYILNINKQKDFYINKVQFADNRVFVIVSDSLRYEVAAVLAKELRKETQSEVALNSMQGIFPTITKFGMAALLPNKELTAEIKSTTKTERLAVLADGASTESNNRENVLKKANVNSVALQYKVLANLKRAERLDLVRGKNVIYIYHDKIDSASHGDENSVFAACDEAIEEIKNMVRIIVNDFGGTRVYITADHGFLYTHRALNEDSKVDKTTDDSLDVEYGRRYAIMQEGASPKYLLPINFLEGNSEFKAYAPKDNIRIKMKGAGINFVHGGISLQEMVVPLIDYRFLRNSAKDYKSNPSKYDIKPVSVKLLSSTRKISNMIFSQEFYQEEPVSFNREACTYEVYFVDEDGKQISDVQKIIADKANDNIQERTFRCTFNLKSQEYKNTAIYYLVIRNDQGMESRVEYQINIAFATGEFNFFS